MGDLIGKNGKPFPRPRTPAHVTPKLAAMYRQKNPDLTDEQIREIAEGFQPIELPSVYSQDELPPIEPDEAES